MNTNFTNMDPYPRKIRWISLKPPSPKRHKHWPCAISCRGWV